MNILISGSSGLVGSRLLPLVRASGHTVTRLVRREPRSADERTWNPDAGQLDVSAFDGIQAVVNLAGDNIGEGRWTEAKKKRILDSRLKTAGLLAETMSKASVKPETFVSASAIGFYGNRGDEVLSESSTLGTGFLPDVCEKWEAAAQSAASAGIRVVLPRFGIILAPDGGAFAKMALPFKLGVGGNMGNGKQYWSWLSVDDAARIILFAIQNKSLTGPVNAVAPQPVTNAEFTKTLGSVVHRPALLPMPAFAARIVLGEMADSLILSSARVIPAKLQSAGFTYSYPDLAGALRHALGKG